MPVAIKFLGEHDNQLDDDEIRWDYRRPRDRFRNFLRYMRLRDAIASVLKASASAGAIDTDGRCRPADHVDVTILLGLLLRGDCPIGGA